MLRLSVLDTYEFARHFEDAITTDSGYIYSDNEFIGEWNDDGTVYACLSCDRARVAVDLIMDAHDWDGPMELN